MRNRSKISQEFNGLSDLHTASKTLKDNPNGLHALRRTISKYGLENDVAIALLHKHFDLQPGEIPVGSIRDREIITTPVKTLNDEAIPWIWKSSAQGEWLPVQYLETTTMNISLGRKANTLSGCSGFWKEATRVIQQYHLANILGLALMVNGAIGLADTQILIERTNTDERHSISQETQKHVDDIETFWAVIGDTLSPLGSCGMCKPKDPQGPRRGADDIS